MGTQGAFRKNPIVPGGSHQMPPDNAHQRPLDKIYRRDGSPEGLVWYTYVFTDPSDP
jgi:hypothetical protein